jgi:integrase/recombinase XerC
MSNNLIHIKSNTSAVEPIEVIQNPLDEFIAGQLTEQTRKAYLSDLRQFFGIGNLTIEHIQEVSFHDLIAYRNELVSQGYKKTTINRKLASLKAFFKMLKAAGMIENNPADSSLVRGFRQEENLTGKTIPQQTLQNLIKQIATTEDILIRTRDTALVYMLTFGGLRRSEAAQIHWDDLQQDGVFHILSLRETKSGVPQDIKLQDGVIHYLEDYKSTLLKHGYSVQGSVFISLSRNDSHGLALSDHAINNIVKRHALKAGITQNITAHMFRHTCCTLAIEGGAKPQQVQAHLRHKDLKTTMRYYENRERLLDNASDYINIS